MKAGHIPEGMAELLKVQQTSPNLPAYMVQSGHRIHSAKARARKAIAQLEQLVKLAPQEPVAHHNLGVAYKSAGRLQEAEREFLGRDEVEARIRRTAFSSSITSCVQADRKDEAKKELQLFLAARKAQEGALGQEDAEWCDYAEIYDPLEGTRRPTSVPQKYSPRRLNVNADAATGGRGRARPAGQRRIGRRGLVRAGIVLLAHGSEELKNTGLEDVRDVVAVAPGDFDNDGLPDLCVVTKNEATLWRNLGEMGSSRRSSHFPGAYDGPCGSITTAITTWTCSCWAARPKLFRKRRQGRLRGPYGRFPVCRRACVRGEVFRLVPDTQSLDLRVEYEGGKTVVYRDQFGRQIHCHHGYAAHAGETRFWRARGGLRHGRLRRRRAGGRRRGGQ